MRTRCISVRYQQEDNTGKAANNLDILKCTKQHMNHGGTRNGREKILCI